MKDGDDNTVERKWSGQERHEQVNGDAIEAQEGREDSTNIFGSV